MTYPVSFQEVQAAAERIKPYAHRTQVLSSKWFNAQAGNQILFKCENLQKVGAFKFRGAMNAVCQLEPSQASNGVVTHSSGNHAQALALAAQLKKIPAYIVMPSNAPSVKRDAVEEYGAKVIECEPTQAARESTAETVRTETGATFIHPYNHPHIIAGQGTAALELLLDSDPLDFLIAPVGGGGLISGTCIVAQNCNPSPIVLAAEPSGADDAFRSKQSGTLLPSNSPQTVADGLLTSLGDLTWPFVRDVVKEVVTVTEPEIIAAMKSFWERTKLIIEPSSATAVAVALKYPFPSQSRIGVILSGGNVDLNKLPWA